MKKPNILFAIADDASHFGYLGYQYVRTPNIDALARDGVILENMFTTNPKCAPSRACILTGMYPWQLKEGCNHYTYFPAEVSVYPDILEANGYFIGYTGKGWAPGDYRHYGRTRNPAGPTFNERTKAPPEGTQIRDVDYHANFCDFLVKKPEDKPFYFWYGGFEPHRPYNLGEAAKYGRTIDEVDYIPSYLPDDEIVRQDFLDYAFEIEWFDRHFGMMVAELSKTGELDNTLIIVTSDNGMAFPRIKGQMYEQDFHLPMMAYWKGKIIPGRTVCDLLSFADIAPTILEAAGIDSHPQMEGKSFLAQLLAKESGTIDSSRNRVYFGREKHDVGRTDDLGYPVRCIRSEQYLYIINFEPQRWPAGNPETYYTNVDSSPTKDLIIDLKKQGVDKYYDLSFGKRPSEELYDIIGDPECIENLAGDDSLANIKTSLKDELLKMLENTKDPRMEGNGDIFEKSPWLGNDGASWKALTEGRFIGQPHWSGGNEVKKTK